MIILFQLILITTIWCLGLTIATQEDMVLHPVRVWAESKKSKLFEPLIICEWCMPSIHSVFAYAFAFGLGLLPLKWDWQLLIRWPLVVMGSSFVCGVAWNIYKTINIVKEKSEVEIKYLENKEVLTHFDIIDRKDNHRRQRFQSEK